MISVEKISNFEYKVTVKSSGKIIGWFILDIDGTFYFISEGNSGYWSDYVLIELGQKLKEINEKTDNT